MKYAVAASSWMPILFCMSGAQAQVINHTPPQVQQGMFSSFPVGLRFRGGTDPYTIEIKRIGTPNGPLGVVPTAVGAPDWSSVTTYSHSSTTPLAFEVDGMSTGNGVFPPPDNDGTVQIGTEFWGAMTLSVEEGAIGEGRSHFHSLWRGGKKTGSELVSVYLPGGSGIDPTLMGSTVVEMRRSDLGLGLGDDRDVTAFDFALPGIQEDGGATPLFRTDGVFYFSVTPEWADAHPEPLFRAGSDLYGSHVLEPCLDPADTRAHPGEIYFRQWHNNAWTTPIVFLSVEELGLNRFADPKSGRLRGDVDAVEVNKTGETVFFSPNWGGFSTSTHEDDRSQLMCFTPGVMQSPKPLKHRGSGVRVAKGAGVRDNPGGDEIDGACAIDPESGPTISYPDFGISYTHNQAYGFPMGLSVSRGWGEGTTQDDLVVQVTGFGTTKVRGGTLKVWVSVTPPVSLTDPAHSTQWFLRGEFPGRTSAMNALQVSVEDLPVYSPANSRTLWWYATYQDRNDRILSASLVSRVLY